MSSWVQAECLVRPWEELETKSGVALVVLLPGSTHQKVSFLAGLTVPDLLTSEDCEGDLLKMRSPKVV